MAAEVRVVQQVAVDEQPHARIAVVHQTQHAHRAGCDIQQLEHMLRGGKRQPRAADLVREILCAKRLMSRHQQQVKRRLLPVREKEVLADPGTQHLLHGGAGLDRVGSVVVDAIIAQPQTVEQVVAAQLLIEPARVLGPAVIYGLVNKHGVTP